jgi:hypothetical protein
MDAVVTDDTGFYSVEKVDKGTASITVTASGYSISTATPSVDSGKTVTVDIGMTKS